MRAHRYNCRRETCRPLPSRVTESAFEPPLRGNRVLARDLPGVFEPVLRLTGLEPAGIERSAARGLGLGILVLLACRCQFGARLFDAQLQLFDPAEAVGLGLRLRFFAGLFEIGEARGPRRAFELDGTRFALQSEEAVVVRQRIVDMAHRRAGVDRSAGYRNRGRRNPVDRRADDRKLRVDHRIAADAQHELLIEDQEPRREQSGKKQKLRRAPPRNQRSAGRRKIAYECQPVAPGPPSTRC